MSSSTEMNAFDNEGYVKGNESSLDVAKNDMESNNNAGSISTKSRFANMSDEEKKVAKRGILKNVVIISFAFMLLFTAFQSMANLQSSINKVTRHQRLTKQKNYINEGSPNCSHYLRFFRCKALAHIH